MREVACIGAVRTLLCAEIGGASLPAIAIAAGVHGDEPAGPWALLAMVQQRDLDPAFAYRLWPCTNPSGFEAGTRENAERLDVNRSFGGGGKTAEARAIVTANRDRKFALSLDLHEDCDADGFYCYEYGEGDVGRTVIDAVASAGFPIQDLARCDLGGPIAQYVLDEGVVRPPQAVEIEAIGGLSYSLSIVRRATRRALTLETPTHLKWEDRVRMHRIAVKAAVRALSKNADHG